MSIIDQFEQDVETAIPTDDALHLISSLAVALVRLESDLLSAEERVEYIKAQIKKVTENDLPLAMQQAGLTKFELRDGSTISVKEKVYASIPKANEQHAFKWLRENGHADLIKNEVKVGFGRGEDEYAIVLKKFLDEQNLPYDEKVAVNVRTLAAFIREQRENGVDIPLDLLGAYIVNEAKVSLPKAPKARKGVMR